MSLREVLQELDTSMDNADATNGAIKKSVDSIKDNWEEIEHDPFSLVLVDPTTCSPWQKEIKSAFRKQLVRYILLKKWNAWLLAETRDCNSAEQDCVYLQRAKFGDTQPVPCAGKLCAFFENYAINTFTIQEYSKPTRGAPQIRLQRSSCSDVPNGSILFLQQKDETETAFKQRVSNATDIYRAWTRWSMVHTLKEMTSSSGSYWVPYDAFRERLKFSLDSALTTELLCQRDEYVTLAYYNDVEVKLQMEIEKFALYTALYTDSQSQYEGNISDISATLREVEGKNGRSFDAVQRQALVLAVTNPVMILTGGAGTGKTTVTNAIVQHLRKTMRVTLAAPTGKAAMWLADRTGHKANTTHYLWFNKARLDGALILDEQSLQELHVLLGVLRKHNFSKLILVGDPAQLPCVGPGQFLKDILARTDYPRVELDHIYRARAGGKIIASNARNIRKGCTDLTINDSFRSVIYPKWFKNQLGTITNTVVTQAQIVFQQTGAYPQVITDMNKLAAGINLQLRNVVHPLTKEDGTRRAQTEHVRLNNSKDLYTGDYQFRVDERVIVTDNHYYRIPFDDADAGELEDEAQCEQRTRDNVIKPMVEVFPHGSALATIVANGEGGIARQIVGYEQSEHVAQLIVEADRRNGMDIRSFFGVSEGEVEVEVVRQAEKSSKKKTSPSKKRKAETTFSSYVSNEGEYVLANDTLPGTTILNFGKHRGKTFDQMYQKNKGWTNWALTQDRPGGQLSKFVQYARERKQRRKRQRTSEIGETYDASNSYRQILVNNGEVGTVRNVGRKALLVAGTDGVEDVRHVGTYAYADVDFGGGKIIHFRTKYTPCTERKEADLRSLAPAYAITANKSQGSEYASVIYASKWEKKMNTNERFYTAITRAQELVVFVHQNPSSISDAVTRRTPPRKSFLFLN